MKNMSSVFMSCTSLKYIPDTFVIPSTVENMLGIFWGCSELERVPTTLNIPNGVTTVEGLFADCPKLNTLPTHITIPSSVSSASIMFRNCNSIPNITVEINANFGEYVTYYNMFASTNPQTTVTLTGTSSNLNAIKSDNGSNVVIKQ
jgi:hypothetical protein